MFLPSGVQLDERCCFGDAAAATKCARVSNLLVAEVRTALDRAVAAREEAEKAAAETKTALEEAKFAIDEAAAAAAAAAEVGV